MEDTHIIEALSYLSIRSTNHWSFASSRFCKKNPACVALLSNIVLDSSFKEHGLDSDYELCSNIFLEYFVFFLR